MTRNEKRLLGAAIKAVAHFDENEWYDLKREIFDFGYQPEYPAQGAFYDPADREMAKLSGETKAALIAEWRSQVPRLHGVHNRRRDSRGILPNDRGRSR